MLSGVNASKCQDTTLQLTMANQEFHQGYPTRPWPCLSARALLNRLNASLSRKPTTTYLDMFALVTTFAHLSRFGHNSDTKSCAC